MADKVFAQGVFIKTQQTQYGDILKLNVRVEDFKKFLDENAEESGWINLDIMSKREVDEKGRSHNMVLNTFQKAQDAQAPAGEDDDLPF